MNLSMKLKTCPHRNHSWVWREISWFETSAVVPILQKYDALSHGNNANLLVAEFLHPK